MSKISAVILSYNKAWIWPTFLRSLEGQIRKPDEVIVVDDGSVDGTREKVQQLPPLYQKVILSGNGGQGRARNVGFSKTTGDLVIFLDGDLTMRTDMLLLMDRALAHHPDISFAYCHYDRKGTRRNNVRAMPWNPKKLERSNYISTMSMVRREHLPVPPFDESLKRYEDWDLWVRMMKAGRRGMLVDQVLFTAHYTNGDLSGRGESIDWYKRVCEKHGFTA